MLDPPPKYHRLTLGREVRLAGAYFVTCTDIITDDAGNITEVHATYDPVTKSGTGFTARKVKGTIHWVCAKNAVPIQANLYDYLFITDPVSSTGQAHAEDGLRFNENSITIAHGYAEPSISQATEDDRYQFMRNAFFTLDPKASTPDKPIFNRTVELKSSYKPQ